MLGAVDLCAQISEEEYQSCDSNLGKTKADDKAYYIG
jgi:hypothetical protein